jgi:hypothetical protein
MGEVWSIKHGAEYPTPSFEHPGPISSLQLTFLVVRYDVRDIFG